MCLLAGGRNRTILAATNGMEFNAMVPTQGLHHCTLGDDIGSLTELRVLDLSSNRDLGGPLTPAIGKLIQLINLALIDCSFSGNVPSELGNLAQLEFLEVCQ